MPKMQNVIYISKPKHSEAFSTYPKSEGAIQMAIQTQGTSTVPQYDRDASLLYIHKDIFSYLTPVSGSI